MKFVSTAVVALSVVCPLPCAGQNAAPPTKEELLETFTRALPDDAFGNVETFVTNGFRLESSTAKELGRDLKPTGKEMTLLAVSADDTFRVGIERGREGMSLGGGIALFHRDTGTPMLSAGDHDGDGRIDILTYGVVDADGDIVIDVIDYEADGQPDFRINFKESYFEVWHIDRWYRAESRDGRRGIVIDGRFVELERRDNRFYVP